MKITVKNLGVLKQAELELGDLTIICGLNNTGKTYVTYALFGFLATWREMLSIEISDDIIKQMLADGVIVISIDVREYLEQFEEILNEGCQVYTQQLPKIFAAREDRFKETEFQINLDRNNIKLDQEIEFHIGAVYILSIIKAKNSTELVITLLEGKEKEKAKIPDTVFKRIIEDVLQSIIFKPFFPRPFIASAERTGAAIFYKELNFARNRLLEEIGQTSQDIDPRELLSKVYQDYALPIKRNVDFIRDITRISKKNSFITEKYPDILADFADIIGGEYVVTSNDQLYYVPKKGKRTKLSMDESSSAVRSLLDIGFYLRHEAQPGDLLMIDEPELSLHPENQRRIARLFARLVNLGIKIFITTHSDYIIRELNTLIMLYSDKPYLKLIAEEEGYRQEELMSWEKVKVYIAEEAPIKLEGKKRKIKAPTLTSANIDPELGIDARSFALTIDTMNRIQEAIVWGQE